MIEAGPDRPIRPPSNDWRPASRRSNRAGRETGGPAPAGPLDREYAAPRALARSARGVLLPVLAMPSVVSANHIFSDVPTSSTFHAVINTLKHAGFTSGCTPTTYCPNDPVSRAQMAAFLVRSAGRMEYQTITDLSPVADQPFASVTVKTEGRAQIWANATFYMNILRGGSDFYPCQGRTYIAIDDVVDQSSYAYGVGHEIPPVSGAITEQIGQQSVKVVNGGSHVVELFYDGVIVGSCGSRSARAT